MKLPDLGFAQEELARPGRLVVEGSRLGILVDVPLDPKSLSPLDLDVGLLEGGFVVPKGLDLGTTKDQTRFEGLQDLEIVARFFVLDQELLAGSLFLGLPHVPEPSRKDG